MCRLLAVQSNEALAIEPHLEAFAKVARDSTQYQGHGWGCAWLNGDGAWQVYRNIAPIWQDANRPFGETTLLLAHARSAYRDEGITVENNMPFLDDRRVFIFNGELQGVRLREEGRIGAEKLFNFIRRFDHGDLGVAVQKATAIIEQRSRFVRAMNIVIADRETVCTSTLFNDDPAYFTMHYRLRTDGFVICSEPYPGEKDWEPIPNRSLRCFP